LSDEADPPQLAVREQEDCDTPNEQFENRFFVFQNRMQQKHRKISRSKRVKLLPAPQVFINLQSQILENERK
jgi:hypothetical protein